MSANAEAVNAPAESAPEAATTAEQLAEENENVEAVRPHVSSSFLISRLVSTLYSSTVPTVAHTNHKP